MSNTTTPAEGNAAESKRPDPILDALEMGNDEPAVQATKAIRHALRQIRENPNVGWYLGAGTQTFALLTEALASLVGKSVREVREAYLCRNAKNPANADAVEACERIAGEFKESGFEISIGAIEDAVNAVKEGREE